MGAIRTTIDGPKLNKAVIPHHTCTSIPIYLLKQQVSINEKYLKEKSTWYMVEDKLKYFKVRNDCRLFTEQFFSMFAKQIMDLDTLDYQAAYVRVDNPEWKKSDQEKKLGLLSDNFQQPNYNYYLISELLNTDVSDLICYSGYSLMNLLLFFKETLCKEDYENVKLFLIKLFISDAFTLQVDRNYHNIGFEIPKIEGVSYKERLRPGLLMNNPLASKYICLEDGAPKLKGFRASKVYDSERILGLDHKNISIYEPNMAWNPLFPYENELLFETQEQAKKASIEMYDGLDPNLTELYLNFSKETKPYLERLAYDDEYRKIFEHFSTDTSQIHLLPQTQEYFENVLEERRREFQKVLKL
ncbi:MAG: hypothetical protein ACM3O4_01155 [Ignavibacteriales bacterium]